MCKDFYGNGYLQKVRAFGLATVLRVILLKYYDQVHDYRNKSSILKDIPVGINHVGDARFICLSEMSTSADDRRVSLPTQMVRAGFIFFRRSQKKN